MSTKESLDRLAEVLREWQHVENASVVETARIIDATRNPVIRLVMEIIQADSAMHHRVEQFILDAIERQAVTLTVEDVEQVWGALEAHIQAERRTEQLIQAARKALAGTKEIVPLYFLSYLAHDEAKHDRLLEDLGAVKRGMFKSA
jgi:hypothetical protein